MPRSSRWDKATGELAHCFERLFSHKTYLLCAFPVYPVGIQRKGIYEIRFTSDCVKGWH
jgi:hypothetical protein